MTKRKVAVDTVNIAAALALALENASGFQFRDDLLDGAFGDSHGIADLPQSHLGIAGEAQEDVGVVCEKRPTCGFSAGLRGFFHLRVDG